MEWREQSTVSCEAAFREAQRWVEEVSKKKFGHRDFRSALENGVLLCDLINRIKPGIIKRVNRLSTPIAGLDNVNVFLKACGKLGLKEAQLFHPGDLQDLSTRVTVKKEETKRRLKNVLITIYWLGRKAQADPFYNGPHLNLKAFEGLLGIALSKALEDSAGQKGSIRDSGFGDGWYAEKDELFSLPSGHRREDSLDSLDSVESRPLNISSDAALKGSSEGCGSDVEPDFGFRMADSKETLQYRRSLVIEPRNTAQFNQFLPSKDRQTGYFPAPLRKKRAERHEDNRRSWASPMYTEEDGTFTRSKSVSEIPEEPTVLRQVRYEDLQKIRAQVKECEDKWQDDLTKWKNRRRSINSDIVKKKEEREQIEQIDSGRSTRGYKTFREMQEDRESGEQVAPSIDAGSLYSASERKPPTRSLPGQSCASDTLCAPADGASVPPTVASQERNRQARSLLPEGPAEVSRDHPGHGHTDPIRPALDNQAGTTQESSAVSSNSKPEDHRPYSSGPLYTSHSMDTKPGMARVSVSLPRSYHRSDSSRLTSVVTPRPFGTQSTKISSLPRTFIMDDSHKRFNGEIESHKPSRYSQFVTSEDETRSQSSSVQSSNEDEDEEERQVDQRNSSSAPQTGRNALQPDLAPKLNSESNAVQEYYSDMRVSLNQKPNSSQDFGFQTDWDSTGAHVKSIRQGSPAELCQLQVGDEILAVGGRLVSKMSYDEWKGSLDAALQQGSLVMDVRRHGKNNWDKDLPSLPYKSHKTINLTSMDTTIVGGPEKYVSSSGKFASIPPRETVTNTEVSSQPVKGQAPKGINGGFRDEPMAVRNQEYEPIALRNFKRRSEFFEQQASSDSASSSLVYLCGGSDSAISDLPVPSISMPSNRWSWDPEEERRRQEKWQKEQERQLQEKYKRDQEVLEETWRRAQLDAMKNNAVRNEEQVISEEAARSAVTLCSPLGPPSEHVLPPFEKHGQEATEPEEEEEGLQREEWQQEAAWLPEQQRKREKQEEEEERRQPEDEKEQRQQKVDEWPKIQEVDEEQCKESRRLQEEQWSGPSYEFAKVLPEISVSDRTKSKSTSELDDVDKPRAKVASGGMSETLWSQRRRGPSLSPAEQERQQILQEMRKKTQLLTDSSWIRQRSISINKEPVALVGPIRRGESLDNLDSARPWRPSSWTSGPASYSRPQSSFSGSSYSRFGASTLPTSLSTGSLRQNAWPPASSPSPPAGGASDESLFKNHPSSQKSRSVSGRKMCTHCDLPLGKGAAMVIESLGLCYHLSCFKCNSCKCDLGGSESGAEVRIRNGQLYCNDCYVRFKTGHPTSM
ncbi:LIM domain only protein 7 isoform X14 [Brienomyrus brachyistius]|uniref:LIM domain only protein 7 isoform X14 n=1 Tax=Brienomyrus brachyistius TaxID=42636 RepID=UPI0020B45CFF|nr:LIM domain only protein 7 isoform X14 [Brienomyrus brachyistius]